MKMRVPIYLANVTFGKYEKKGRSTSKVSEVEKKEMIVKGFTMEDIIRRKKDSLVNQLGLKGDYRVERIELLSQHSWGVDE